MYRNSAKRLSAFVVSIAAVLLTSGALLGAEQTAGKVVKPRTSPVLRVGVSRPMREMRPISPVAHDPNNLREIEMKSHGALGQPSAQAPHDPLVQTRVGSRAIPSGPSFDGLADVDGVQPADTTMDVSASQILQWVNLSWEVLDKSGNLLPGGGPFEGSAFWSGLGGNCDAPNNGGDVLVRWDQFASKWVVAQLSYQGTSFDLCVAVSQTSDATGAYFQYDFFYSNTDINDYPHWGLWPDAANNGYYVTARNFAGGFSFTGMTIMALDRAALLAGTGGTAQIFDVGALIPTMDGLLPADLRGPSVPASGSLETYVGIGSPGTDGNPTSVVHLFQTNVDFANPLNSTLTQLPDVPTADFDNSLTGAPQVGGGNLEVIGGFGQSGLLYRADYRLFSDHDSLVFYHDVNVGGICSAGEQGGFRWHEVRGIAVNGPPSLYQEGTYGPCDGTYRWMGSIAQDISGDIAVGFSASSGGGGIVTDPSVHYTGRLASDPVGTMGQGEGTFFDSTQPFGGFRWGDYSMMVVDPVDQCTFWYTTMYGAGDWATRIGSFKFPSCTQGPTGTLEGIVDDGTNGIQGATVSAGLASTQTDVTGHYLMVLPVGTYNMLVTKYGFLPGSASGVPVTDGGDTIQNFTLSPAPSVLVNGVVRDGSGGGWPLYAKIVITGAGAPTFTIFTDPVTGYYSITLVTGITYNFAITAVSPGYNPGGGSLPLLSTAPIVQNWDLTVDALTCNAPGYSQVTNGVFENFDAGVLPPGWTLVTNQGNPWSFISSDPCGFFTNPTGGTGSFTASNSNCDGNIADDNELRTPAVDMSTFSSAVLRFNQDYNWLFDNADVDVSLNGGTTWSNVLAQSSSARGPRQTTIDITALAAGQPSVMARFHNYNAFFAWWWAVDNVLLGQATCGVNPGGLVVGNVRDGNTAAGINGATVENLTSGGSTTTFATPQDPNQDDGLYILFSESGPESFEASATGYTLQDKSTSVVPNSTIRLDFSLAAGRLDASPRPMTSKVDPGDTDTQTLTLSNTGNADADFHIRELNVPAPPLVHHGPFADREKIKEALARIPPDFAKRGYQSGKLSAEGLAPSPDAPKNTRPLVAGDVLATYSATFASPGGLPYGMIYNKGANDFWVSNLDSGFPGDNKDYQFLADGTQTGATIDLSGLGFLSLDGTYNDITGMFWQATNDFFGGSITCIYEIDPAAKALTGNTICPAFPSRQTGLAYNVNSNTYYSGSFFDFVINHFDANGVILDSVNTGLNIAGLAYNRSTGHLFVFNQNLGSGPTDDVYVLDPSNNYAVLGSFVVGPPGIHSAAAGGAEMDCSGHLLLVDQLGGNPILVVDSGEGTECPFVNSIPWVSEDPTDGTVPAGGSTPVAVTFDSTDLRPGLRQAQLAIGTNTPYTVTPVPLNFTVRFLDVLDNVPPGTDIFENFIYAAAGAGIMAGSPYPGCHPGELNFFCPQGLVTRADMAGYIFRSVHGAFTPPPVYTGIFSDVLFNDYNADYIQGIYNDGITAGCQATGDPLAFCPTQSIPRGQMAVFIEKGVRGSGYVPPACVGIFGDAPCPATPAFPYTDWIELLFNDGITAGCSVSPALFCPDQQIPNEQMAVFIVKAFGFPVLP